MLSKTAEYALRILIYLASSGNGGPVLARQISDAVRVPPNYLSKLLHGLRRAGYLEAARGRGGGYRLIRRPAEIRLAQVVELFHDLSSFERCPLSGTACADGRPCAAHAVWRPAARRVVDFLNETTIERLAMAP